MLKIYNTLTRQKEDFVPLNSSTVSLYTCGPTVYAFQHIGNWRTFVFEDLLRRVLQVNGYKVNHVMNATDVGHLSGDNTGDADTGEDRLEKGAKRENKTVWEVAQFYLDDFVTTRDWLNILSPTHFVRATDYIDQQIDLVKKLIAKDLAYETETGIFFDVSRFPEYGKLGGQKLVDKRSAVRSEVIEDKTKKNSADFALWLKTVGKFKDHTMKWSSPWGEGFPGWHIECSAMAMSLLGETIDIHTGGVDHIAIHHTNEIAQSEGATGKLFAKYWMHGEFLMVDSGRMGKSLGNAYTLHDISKKGFDILALRYLYLTTQYRDKLNFTWESLNASQTALNRLRENLTRLKGEKSRTQLSPEKNEKIEFFRNEFINNINDDLNTSRVIAIISEVMKSSIPSEDKYDLILYFDEVLGLDLSRNNDLLEPDIPVDILDLAQKREDARKEGDFVKSDMLRNEILNKGYIIEDSPDGPKVRSSREMK